MNFIFFLFIITIFFIIYIEFNVGNIVFRINSDGNYCFFLENIISFLLDPLKNKFLWNYELLDLNYIFILFISSIFYKLFIS